MQPRAILNTAALFLLLAATHHPARAQTNLAAPAQPLPTYDVATIKVNPSGRLGDVDITTHDDTYVTHNTGVKPMLEGAFGIRQGLIFGLPSWAESARYDVSAKVVDPDIKQLQSLTRDQRRAMLRTLLEDRFSLKWHTETKTLPVFELHVAKDGPKFQPARGKDTEGSDGVSSRNREIDTHNMSIAYFCEHLSNRVGRPVVDKTGLTDKYTFTLHFTPDNETSTENGTDEAPTLFTALEEQLGLKLEGTKDPVTTLVIDTIAPPTEN